MRLTRKATGVGLVLLGLGQPASLHSQNHGFTCLLNFASLSEDASPEDLTAATYFELIDRVGQGKVSAATLEKLFAGENLFDIPEQEGHDVGILRLQMKRFEALVRQREWYTPKVLAAVRRKISERLGRMRDAQQAVKAQEDQVDFEVPLRRLDGMTESPNGRWLLSTNRQNTTPADGRWDMNLYDLKEKKLTRIPGADFLLDRPHFTRDGKFLIFPAPGYRLFRVPFNEGQPDWSAGKYVGEKFEDGRGNYPKFGKDPNLVIAGAHQQYLFLYDVQKGTSVKIDTTKHMAEGESAYNQNSWGFVPGTNDVFLRTNLKSTYDRLRIFTLLPDGQLKLKQTVWEREHDTGLATPEEKFEQHFFFLPDGTVVNSWSKNNDPNVSFYVGKERKKVPFPYPADKFTPARVGPNDSVIVHPTKPEVALLYHNELRTKYFAVHFDFASGQVLGSYELPGKSQEISFSADGEKIIAQPWDKPLHMLHYRHRLENPGGD